MTGERMEPAVIALRLARLAWDEPLLLFLLWLGLMATACEECTAER